MKSKLEFYEYINNVQTNYFKKIANIKEGEISFKSDYNDLVLIKINENSITIKREGFLTYKVKHIKNQKNVIDIVIKGQGLNDNIKSTIFTNDLIIKKEENSLVIKIIYKKDNDEVITNYNLTWR